eukprot:TRINITY_DN20427_c0_g3_i2.p1 TRINITY_DN20427_c0_g3~~TRINITY_DN20427_c0_g3_i2.p1  ORF type:complete len:131 (-),score=28.51 TRINITY_DN20427_c0_g3_i2:896-1288(-)
MFEGHQMVFLHLEIIPQKAEYWAQSMGVSMASWCPICLADGEYDGHLFFQCNFEMEIWLWLLQVAHFAAPVSFSASSIQASLSGNSDLIAKKGLGAAFFITTYYIWITRNKCVFDNLNSSKDRSILRRLR